MDIVMRVHRVSKHPVEVEVHYQGLPAKAVIPEMEVELTEPDGQHGSMQLHFRQSNDVEAAAATFVQGGLVTVSFVASAEPAPVSVETVAAE